MSAQFFFDRLQRATQMDATNKILGRDCHYTFAAIEWKEAYRSSLTGNKQKDFDKDWRKAETDLAAAHKFSDFGKKG